MPPSKSLTPPPESALTQGSPAKSPTKSPAKSPAMSSAKSPAIVSSYPTNFTVPPGWTTDRSEEFFVDWEDSDARGPEIAHAYGLSPGRAVLEDDRGITQIFQSDDKFYIWDKMNDEFHHILARDFSEISHILLHGGLRELRHEPVLQIGYLTR